MSTTDRARAGNDVAQAEEAGDPEAEETPDSGRTGQGRPLSRSAGLLVAVVAAVCVVTAVAHMCLVFLYVAPSNIVSQRYQRQIEAWIYPYFEQNWQLFAPDPESAPQAVSARAGTRSPDGGLRAGGWVDLTAQDVAAVRHDPFPSHTAQNMLRRAWSLYSSVEGAGDQAGSERARMLRQYLTDIAVQRLTARGGGAVDAVQLRVVTTPIAPGVTRSAGLPPPRARSSARYLPWWQVTSHDR